MITNAYVAGFFDGEGCIVLSKNGQCKVTIVQKSEDILRLIQAVFGGSVHKRAATKIGGETFALQFSKKEEMIALLTAIQSYSVVKRAKVDIALKFIGLTQSNNMRKQGPNGHFLPSSNLFERAELRSEFYQN